VRRTDPEIYAGLVLVCRYCGLLDASVAAHQSARTLDPTIRTSIPLTMMARCDFAGALATSSEELDGDLRVLALDALNRRDEAIELAKTRVPGISGMDSIAPARRAILAYLEHRIGDAITALHESVGVDPQNETVFPKFPDGEDVFWTAKLYSRVGRTDLGLAGFRAAVDQGYFCVPLFEREPWLDPLRSFPEFDATLQVARERHSRALSIFTDEGGPALLGVL
jgi:hypothetical protein